MNEIQLPEYEEQQSIDEGKNLKSSGESKVDQQSSQQLNLEDEVKNTEAQQIKISQQSDQTIESKGKKKAQTKNKCCRCSDLCFRIYFNVLFALALIVVNIIYCVLETQLAVNNFNVFMNTMIPGIAISFTMIISWIDFISRKFIFIVAFNLIFIFFIIDSDSYLNRRHKFLFQQLFAFAIAYSLIFWLFIIALVNLVQKYGNKIWVITLLFLAAASFYFYQYKIVNSCDYWLQGFRVSTIQEAPYCQMKVPQYCWYNVFNGYMDFSKFINCEKSKRADLELYKKNFKLNEKDQLYPFYCIPSIAGLDRQKRYYHELQLEVINKTKPFDSLEDAFQSGCEQVIEIKNLELHTKVQKKQQLVLERKKILSQGLSKNVLIIYIDALGRPSIQLKLKKVSEWLKKQNKRLFEFMRYHGSLNYTGENYRKFFFGEYDQQIQSKEAKFGQLQSLTKYYKDAGYITGHSQHDCHTMAYWFFKDYEPYENDEPYDHDGTGFSCDPYQELRDKDGVIHNDMVGANSIIRRCIFGRDAFSFVLEYGKQFWETYAEEKKFMILEFMDSHEGSGEVVTYLDEPLTNLLETLDLNDTTVIFMSDHGWHMHSIFYLLHLEMVPIEAMLPALYIILPEQFYNNSSEQVQKMITNLELNQQSLFDATQLYSTLRVLCNNDKKYLFDLSLFSERPKNLSCLDVIFNKTNPYYCSCTPRQS